MAAQPVSPTDIGDLAFGERSVAPVANVFGVEAGGNLGVITELKQLLDASDELGRSFVTGCGARARYCHAAACATSQANLRADFGALAEERHILNQQSEDVLALAVDHGRMGPQRGQIAAQ